ncbi:hypothetical protein Tco_0228034 [Tanacetum coccineum]
MTVDNVIFQINNVVGNFNYPPNVPAYKPIMKFLRNYPLYNTFTNYPSVVYQNFLREFWSTAVAFDPFPLTDEPEKRPLKEFLIKFLVLNRQRPLTLDFHTFCSSTSLNYNNDKYVDHPTPEGPEASGALSKKRKKPKSKRPPTETKELPPKPTEGSEQSHLVSSGTVHDPQDLERNIQLANTGLPSTLNEGTATHPKDSGGNKQPLDRDITSTTPDEGMDKTSPCPEGSLGDKDSEGNIPPLIWNQYTPLLLIHQGLLLTFLLSEDELDKKSDEQEVFAAGDDMDEMSRVLFNRITKKQWEQHEEASVSYADLKAFINQYYDKNIAHSEQTDKLVEASMGSLDRSNTTISDLYKGLNVITELLKDINNAIKDDLATNRKINEAIKTFAKTSTQTTEILSLVKIFDFFTLQATMQDLQAHALKQEEVSTSWTNLLPQAGHFRDKIYDGRDLSGLQRSTFFSSSGSVTPTLALTHFPANVEGENANTTATEEPPSHTEGETGDVTMAIPLSSIQPTHDQQITPVISHPKKSQATPRINKGKGIATESGEDPSKRLVPASTIICPDLDESSLQNR